MTNVKYSINETFFSEINSKDKAYILGFIWGDGCITTKLYRLSIELASSDLEILYCKKHKNSTKKKLREANLGEKCGNSKLKDKDVGFIKRHPNHKASELAKMFNISPGTVRSIRRGDTWSHVKVKEV